MSAVATSIVCLQNPRTPTNAAPGWIVFDMTFFVRHSNSTSSDTDTEPELAVALVRFYNRGELISIKPEDDLFCMAVCSLCKVDAKVVNDYVTGIDLQEYQFMGDILHLQPLSEVTSLPSAPPYIILNGPATNVNKSTATWHMPISQYAFNTRDASLPVIAHIPDSPRFANGKKPVPSDLNLITAAGPLTEIKYTQDRNVTGVCVAVDQIAFHGRTQTILPPSSPDSSPAKVPQKRRVRVSPPPRRSSQPASLSPQPPEPQTPPRATKKPRLEKN